MLKKWNVIKNNHPKILNILLILGLGLLFSSKESEGNVIISHVIFVFYFFIVFMIKVNIKK